MRFTKGKYAFIVATHTDKAHIHEKPNRFPMGEQFGFSIRRKMTARKVGEGNSICDTIS